MPAASTKLVLQRVPLNKTDIDQALLNIQRKERSNPLPWNGQFSPQLVEVLLDTYAPAGGCVLDPFAGSGTLLLEASGRSLAAFGVDINPAACYLARIYTLANRPLRVRQELCEKLEQLLQKHFPPDLPLFAIPSDKTPVQQKARLVEGIRQEVGQGDASILLAGLFVLCDFFDSGAQSQALF